MSNIKTDYTKLLTLLFFVSITVFSCFYLSLNYEVFKQPVKSIQITLNAHTLSKGMPIMYVYDKNTANINYQKVYRFNRINDSIAEISNLEDANISKFRIYFEMPGKNFVLKNIKVSSNSESKTLSLNDLKSFKHIKKNSGFNFEVLANNGYLDYPYHLIPKVPIVGISVAILVFSFVFYLFLSKTKVISLIVQTKKENFIFILYICSIFLPAPFYNICLIIAALFYIRKFNWYNFKKNKINILFVVLFAIYLINTIFIKENEIRDFSVVERLLPLVIIPIVLASVKVKNVLLYVMFTSLFICFNLFLIATLDYLMLDNFESFSFTEFSKYYHPVYLSYPLFLSICYLQQYYHHREKNVFQIILFLFLIFLGSKTVLVTATLLFIFFFIKVKKNAILFFTIIFTLLISLLIFKPLQKRFIDVLSIEDLSILKEDKIQNSNDKRINGLTFRLILWRESLNTINNLKEFTFGNGVTKSKRLDLKNKINKLGLKHHINYNPHNQYLSTFVETGIIGVLVFILIFILAIKRSIKTKDKLLLVITLFTLISMITESVFGRVRGVYFITTIFIVLTSTKFINELKNTNENRNTRNKRHPK